MTGQVCPFHTDEWSPGLRLADGSIAHRCDRRDGHPGMAAWSWLAVPEPPTVPGMTGLAEELNLGTELPAALAALGDGWFEYGLVERAYAHRQPDGFARLVQAWSHTAIAKTTYSASTYLALTLGRLSKAGSVAYHPGHGTGRWSYNSDISYWSTLPAGDWEHRTSWADVIGDTTPEAKHADKECRSYVPGATAPS